MTGYNPKQVQQGFTLLEVLIVIVIIGVIISVVTLSFGVLDQRKLIAESDRLKMAFNHAADTSLMQQKIIGWFYNKKSNHYQFKRLDSEGEWIQSETRIFRQHELTPITVIQLSEPTFGLQQKEYSPSDKPIEDNNNLAEQPDILFLSSGEYTPFELSFESDDLAVIYLSGDGINTVSRMEKQ